MAMKGGSLAPAQMHARLRNFCLYICMFVCFIYIYVFEELEIHDRVDMLINYDYDYECFNLY